MKSVTSLWFSSNKEQNDSSSEEKDQLVEELKENIDENMDQVTSVEKNNLVQDGITEPIIEQQEPSVLANNSLQQDYQQHEDVQLNNSNEDINSELNESTEVELSSIDDLKLLTSDLKNNKDKFTNYESLMAQLLRVTVKLVEVVVEQDETINEKNDQINKLENRLNVIEKQKSLIDDDGKIELYANSQIKIDYDLVKKAIQEEDVNKYYQSVLSSMVSVSDLYRTTITGKSHSDGKIEFSNEIKQEMIKSCKHHIKYKKGYDKKCDKAIGRKLADYNNLFSQMKKKRKFNDEMRSKCKLNKADISELVDFNDYALDIEKFKDLDDSIESKLKSGLKRKNSFSSTSTSDSSDDENNKRKNKKDKK